MDTDRLIQVAPHYVAMVLLAIIVFTIAEAIVGQLGFWAELVIIAIVVFSYRPAVLALGIAPDAWKE